MNPFDLKGKGGARHRRQWRHRPGHGAGSRPRGRQGRHRRRDAGKNAAALKQLGAGAFAIAADVTDERACRGMVDEAAAKLGRLDILINNAGINIRKRPRSTAWRNGTRCSTRI